MFRNRARCFAFLVLFLFQFQASAQLQVFPLPRKSPAAVTTPRDARKNSTARIQSDTVIMTLPFWDDFSTSKDTPNSSRWINSRSVWISDGIAINEPTINVATLDGLDSTFLPYNPNQIFVNGFTDKLISQPIDLSAVPIGNRGSVYLSFFYQWGGNGEEPDHNDFITLDFLSGKDTTWTTVMTIYPKSNPDPTAFYDTIIQVSDTDYFWNKFQFRFQRFGRESGPFDTWNLDYVYLNDNRSPSDISYPDIAAASGLTPLFGDYYDIPIDHFFAAKKLDSVAFDVQSLNDISTGTSIKYRSIITSKKYYGSSDIPVVNSKNVFSADQNVTANGLMGPFQRQRTKLPQLPNPDDKELFDSLASSILIKLKMKVISGDSANANRVKFDTTKYNLAVNDTVSAFYHLSDHYAYDDGVAEYSAGLTQAGNRLAYQFTMATPEPDTLVGFQVYFPDYGISASQTGDFYLYNDDGNGGPGTVHESMTTQSISVTGVQNQFMTIKLRSNVIVQGTFYFGWKEPQTGHLRVGLDMSHDSGDKMFVNTTGYWVRNDAIHGSFMIRPIFGSDYVTGVTPEIVQNENKYLYPNPNNGTFYVDGTCSRLQVFTLTGQEVDYTLENLGDTNKITLEATTGLYIVRIQHGTRWEAMKVLVK